MKLTDKNHTSNRRKLTSSLGVAAKHKARKDKTRDKELPPHEYLETPHRLQKSFSFEHSILSPVRRKSQIRTFRSQSLEHTKDGSTSDSSENANASLRASSPRKFVDHVVKRIDEHDNTHKLLVIGIAGGSGSGKTTLARAIFNSLGGENINWISHDSYYKDISHLSMEEKEKCNFDHPDALDTALLVEHLKDLINRKPVTIPTYDYTTHSRMTTQQELPSRPIVIVEGILIFTDPRLFSLIDIKIFVDTEDDIRLARRLQRDILERGRTLTGVINQYIDTVRPMHLQYVEPSKRNADIIVPVGLNSVALDLVVSKLQLFLVHQAVDNKQRSNGYSPLSSRNESYADVTGFSEKYVTVSDCQLSE